MTLRRSAARPAKAGSSPAPVRIAATGKAHPYLAGAAVGAAALALAAYVNHRLAAAAERRNPPLGKFVEVEGVRLHYLDEGEGEALVLLHGNGSMVQDFVTSGLVDWASRVHRVIAFDRPGYGHSERPRNRIWTADAQAELIEAALRRIGVARAIVLGHSWGCSVAVALALRAPHLVKRLVLASGYYFPSVRADVVATSGPAVPLIGDVLRYTVSPLVARLTWPLVKRRIFGPAPVPEEFEEGFPKEMVFRPSQIRASAAESALMIPVAAANRARYAGLRMPVIIVAGEEDRLVDIDDQSARLHAELPGSAFYRVRGAGHMVHQTAPRAVIAALEKAAAAAEGSAPVSRFRRRSADPGSGRPSRS